MSASETANHMNEKISLNNSITLFLLNTESVRQIHRKISLYNGLNLRKCKESTFSSSISEFICSYSFSTSLFDLKVEIKVLQHQAVSCVSRELATKMSWNFKKVCFKHITPQSRPQPQSCSAHVLFPDVNHIQLNVSRRGYILVKMPQRGEGGREGYL